MSHWRCSYVPVLIFLSAMALIPGSAQAQTRLEAHPHLLPDDEGVLASGRNRKDLDCRVSANKPAMQFDLRFHTGYVVTLPLKAVAGDGNRLRMLIRVTPLATPQSPVFLTSHMSVPPIDRDTGGDTEISGEYVVGPGRYRVDWLMRDRGDRVCSAHWNMEAKLDGAFENVFLPIPADTVAATPQDGFRELPEVQRDPGRPLSIKVLINFSPGEPGEAVLRGRDLQAIVSMLRAIARESLFGRFAVVAFSMDEQRVIYRQPEAPGIDFPALGEAVKTLKFGTVDYGLLRDRNSATNFLAALLTEHLGPQPAAPDAIVIISPKVMLDKEVAREKLIQAGRAECPVFYMNYNARPYRHPWRGTISAALKAYRAVEYTITAPRDLSAALVRMTSKLKADR